jgi:hypothetical protein
MAVLFQDSMDLYGASADITTRYDVTNGPGTIVATGGRYGGKGLSPQNTSAWTGKVIPFCGDSPTNKFFWSSAVKVGAFVASSVFFGVSDSAGNTVSSSNQSLSHITVGPGADGKCYVYRAGTQIAVSSSVVFILNAWHRVEVGIYIDDTAGTVEVRVDGVTAVSFTGDTRNANTQGIGVFFLLSNSATLTVFDDIMIWNGQGLAPTDFVGDFRIDAYTPTANGSTVNASFAGAGVTVAYQAVDDPVLNNADTDYVLDDVINDINLFAMADLATTPTSVIGVGIVVAARADNVGTRKIQLGNKSGAVTGWSGTDITLPAQAAYVVRSQFFPLDLATGAAWTGAGVNAIEVGFKVMA